VAWKISKITTIAKTHTPCSPTDYRPISVLQALSKAMEIIMQKQITVLIESNRMLSYLQSGFRAKYSKTTALLIVTNDPLMASEKKLLSISIYLIFRRHSIVYGPFTTNQIVPQRTSGSILNNEALRFLPLVSGVVQESKTVFFLC
jgi:hypothetical protein